MLNPIPKVKRPEPWPKDSGRNIMDAVLNGTKKTDRLDVDSMIGTLSPNDHD